jgi:hypothetical protein
MNLWRSVLQHRARRRPSLLISKVHRVVGIAHRGSSSRLQHQQWAAIQKTVDDHTYRIHYQQRLTMGDGQDQNGAMGMSSMLKEVQELADKFKVEEDEQYISPYAHLEKATVLQEAR